MKKGKGDLVLAGWYEKDATGGPEGEKPEKLSGGGKINVKKPILEGGVDKKERLTK